MGQMYQGEKKRAQESDERKDQYHRDDLRRKEAIGCHMRLNQSVPQGDLDRELMHETSYVRQRGAGK